MLQSTQNAPSVGVVQRPIRSAVRPWGDRPITRDRGPHLRARRRLRGSGNLDRALGNGASIRGGVLRAARSGRDPIPRRVRGGDPRQQGGTAMEALENYTSVLAMLSAALLLVAAGLAKKQLSWKAKPVPMRRRRRRP